MGTRTGKDIGGREMDWVMYEKFGRRRDQVSKLFPSSLLADVITETSENGSEECWLELPTDQGYGATCVPADIDE